MKSYKLDMSTVFSKSSFDVSGLNEKQAACVTHTGGPLLVVSGAGSGKTKTLVYRVARLIHDGALPSSILLLTFTRQASREMMHRAAELVDQRCQQISGGTFHSFAHELLRRYASQIGFESNFTILDRSDAEELVGMIRREMNLHQSAKRFPKRGTVLSAISKSINTGLPVGEVVARDMPQFLAFTEDIEKLMITYQARKQVMNIMDYDDLLVFVVKLLDEHADLRAQLSDTYKHVLVDEYQDVNHLQSRFIRLLCHDSHDLMVVGDDCQCIYSFRGADYENMLSFESQFPGGTVVMLDENYRSTQPILSLTNRVIGQAEQGYSKTLFTSKTGGEAPVYIEAKSEFEQSMFVCQKILEYREDGIELSEMAVLVRSGWHANDLEVQLKRAGLPFVKMGGFKFVESAHVKDVLAMVKLVENPGDAISWQRVLSLFNGVGPKTADKLFFAFANAGFNVMGFDVTEYKGTVYEADIANFFSALRDVQDRPLLDILPRFLSVYQPYFEQKYDDFTKRKADLTSLEGLANRYASISAFLSDMSLEPPENSQVDSEAQAESESKLTVSTIHSAKGLEWKAVFMLSCVDGYLPSFMSLEDSKQLEEERRLLYVALTRAKEHLFILKPHFDSVGSQQYRRGGMSFSRLSRFLEQADFLQVAEQWALTEPDSPKYQF